MKKVAKTVGVAAILSVVVLSACSTVQPDAGHEAVLVRKPLIFGSGGVDPTPVKTGLSTSRLRRKVSTSTCSRAASTRNSPT